MANQEHPVTMYMDVRVHLQTLLLFCLRDTCPSTCEQISFSALATSTSHEHKTNSVS
eukprot:m.22995 g.22995  ORF g.22995 m.22995 type:complete len:57 (+) comp8438_c0_seq1:1098-1268(+)